MTIIKVDGDFRAKALKIAGRYPRGAKSLHYLGGSQALSVASQIGLPDATVIGTPVYNSDHCVISGVNGFQVSGADYTGPTTIFAVVKQPAANILMVGHTYQAGPTTGYMLTLNTGTYRIHTSGGSNPDTQITADNGSSFALVVVRASFVSRVVTVDYFNGTRKRRTASPTVVAGTARPFRIGGASGQATTFACAAAGHWERYLSDAEVQNLYDRMKFDMATRGVTVL